MKFKFCSLCPHWMVHLSLEMASYSCEKFSWCRDLVCAGQRSPSLNIDTPIYQLVLCRTLDQSTWIGGLVFCWFRVLFCLVWVFLQKCLLQILCFHSQCSLWLYTLAHSHSCCWTVAWCEISELLVSKSHRKSLGILVPQSETFCTNTGDFWSELSSFSRKLFQGSTTRVGLISKCLPPIWCMWKSKLVAGRPIRCTDRDREGVNSLF